MRAFLPSFILRRLPRAPRPVLRDDPADMGTEVGLDASIVGWEERRAAGQSGQVASDEAPMHWLRQAAARKAG